MLLLSLCVWGIFVAIFLNGEEQTKSPPGQPPGPVRYDKDFATKEACLRELDRMLAELESYQVIKRLGPYETEGLDPFKWECKERK